jgi:hypothetical protein
VISYQSGTRVWLPHSWRTLLAGPPQVRRWFPNDEWQHMYYTDNVSATSFHDFYSPELNLSVVTVRGTYR